MEACPGCGATPRTPLLCEACGRMLDPRTAPTPFEALGFAPAYDLDPALVRKRLLTLSRALHPDVHGTGDAPTRRLAESNTAALNAAYQVLSDDFRRADHLVGALGGPAEDEERSMPAEFLAEALEWNEAIAEARGAGRPSAALAGLEQRLKRERLETLGYAREKLVPLPQRGAPVLREVRQRLNAVRYIDRALREIGETHLAARAASH